MKKFAHGILEGARDQHDWESKLNSKKKLNPKVMDNIKSMSDKLF